MSASESASSRLYGDFDYIVVGAGSAGCAVASRLASDPNCRVLLVEAGHRGRSPLIRIPGGVRFTIGSPKHDWMMVSEPDPSANGRRHAWPRGKMLGGSSGINGMIYARGAAADYDAMAERGMPGWRWDDCLPYFRQSEDFEGGASLAHGAGGPMAISYIRTPHYLSQRFLEACAERGVSVINDINGGMDVGVGYVHATQRNGARWTTADGYLRASGQRKNLQILTHVAVRKVSLREGRAEGIEFLRDGVEYVARAHREVIVSAGTIMSPHLLMHSGIGDPGALQALGLPVTLARPEVGRNFHDHCDVQLQYEVNVATFNMKIDIFNMLKYGVRWLVRRDGPVASVGAQIFGFARSRPGLGRPDVAYYFQPNGYRLEPGKIVFNREPTVTFMAMVSDPKSRGAIRLASSDPQAAPLIEANLLGAPEDQSAALHAIRLGRHLMGAPALKPYIVGELSPGAVAQSDDELLAHARKVVDPVLHSSGTCRMGTDDNAVVDPWLRVRGVRGLRVADMSVVATVPGANTNAVAIMIGERCADFILRGVAGGA